jgi:hypothetical protein
MSSDGGDLDGPPSESNPIEDNRSEALAEENVGQTNGKKTEKNIFRIEHKTLKFGNGDFFSGDFDMDNARFVSTQL